MEIKGCTAVVTGGASGLGEASVRLLVKEGGKVAILDLDEERGRRIASELQGSAIFCKTDVTSESSVEEARSEAHTSELQDPRDQRAARRATSCWRGAGREPR